jgi:Protein of unknown function (DUF3153)
MAGGRWRPWGLGLLISLLWLLGGCFQADLTLRFDHHHHGQWTQTLTLGERNLAMASDALDPWLQQVRPPIQRLGGHLQQTASTLTVTIPFSTPADLANRITTVFTTPSSAPTENLGRPDPDQPPAATLALLGVGTVPFTLTTKEQNWVLVSRVRLVYDLDLRNLAPSLTTAAPGAGITFRLQVPWGMPSVEPESLAPVSLQPHEAQWNLPLGQISHLAMVFWLPNGVGLGGLALAILILIGYVLRYRWLGPPPSPRS